MSDEQTGTGAPEEAFESQLDAIRIRLQSFEGPLDLLVHLIKKNKVDVYDIPIALITRQYLDYLDLMQELNLDMASEFLVMAATLIHIKSKMLLPRPETATGDPVEEEDPRDQLVRRLLEHQRFKAAAELLHERETIRNAQWTRPDARVEAIAGEDYEPELEVDIFSLLSAFKAVLERGPRAPAGAAASRGDLDRGPHRAAARAALGVRRLRLHRAVRRRRRPPGPDRHLPGAARDDPPQAGPRLPERPARQIRVYKRARPKDARTRSTIPKTNTGRTIRRRPR